MRVLYQFSLITLFLFVSNGLDLSKRVYISTCRISNCEKAVYECSKHACIKSLNCSEELLRNCLFEYDNECLSCAKDIFELTHLLNGSPTFNCDFEFPLHNYACSLFCLSQNKAISECKSCDYKCPEQYTCQCYNETITNETTQPETTTRLTTTTKTTTKTTKTTTVPTTTTTTLPTTTTTTVPSTTTTSSLTSTTTFPFASLWMIGCQLFTCKFAIEACNFNGCLGKEMCTRCVQQHTNDPACMTYCLNDLFNSSTDFAGNGEKTIVCHKNDPFHLDVCRFYCRSQFKFKYECVTIFETLLIDNSVCRCN